MCLPGKNKISNFSNKLSIWNTSGSRAKQYVRHQFSHEVDHVPHCIVFLGRFSFSDEGERWLIGISVQTLFSLQACRNWISSNSYWSGKGYYRIQHSQCVLCWSGHAICKREHSGTTLRNYAQETYEVTFVSLSLIVQYLPVILLPFYQAHHLKHCRR